MANKIMIGIGLIILITICYGLTLHFKYEKEKDLISYTRKEIEKAFKPIKITKGYKPERVWIKGKDFKDCMKNKKVINNNTVKCRSGYYKEIKVWK